MAPDKKKLSVPKQNVYLCLFQLLVIPALFKPIENVTDIVIGTSHHRPQLNIRYDTDNAPTAPQTNSELNFFV